MQITFSAAGTPAQIHATIDTQARAVAQQEPASWPIAANLRDAIAAHLSHVAPDQSVTVTASATVRVVLAPAAPPAEVPASGSTTPPAIADDDPESLEPEEHDG